MGGGVFVEVLYVYGRGLVVVLVCICEVGCFREVGGRLGFLVCSLCFGELWVSFGSLGSFFE